MSKCIIKIVYKLLLNSLILVMLSALHVKGNIHQIRPIRTETRSNRSTGISSNSLGIILAYALICLCIAGSVGTTVAVTIVFAGRHKSTFVAVSTATTATTQTTTTVTTNTTTTTMSTITFVPTGIYALTISTSATWNQIGITVAGNANGSLGSDLGSLSGPVDIFVDNNGTLYICDRDNNRIMKYYANATSGIDIAGNLTLGSSSSQLNSPKGVAVDQYGAIIVGDSSNYRIQKFPVGSKVATTIAINSLLNPLGQIRDLHIDVNNIIYVTDSDYSRILKFYPYNGIGVILAPTNGSGSRADQLLAPFGNFIDGNQTLYIADRGNHRIQMWLAGGTIGTTIAGVTGIPGSNLNLLNHPSAVIVDNNGYVYVADSGNNRIVKWTTNYTAGGVCIVGCSNVAGRSATQLIAPRDLKFDSQGNLYVSDQGNNRIQKFMIQSSTSPSPANESS